MFLILFFSKNCLYSMFSHVYTKADQNSCWASPWKLISWFKRLAQKHIGCNTEQFFLPLMKRYPKWQLKMPLYNFMNIRRSLTVCQPLTVWHSRATYGKECQRWKWLSKKRVERLRCIETGANVSLSFFFDVLSGIPADKSFAYTFLFLTFWIWCLI